MAASTPPMSLGSLPAEERTSPSSSCSSLRQKSVARFSPPPILRRRSTKNALSILRPAPLRSGSATSMAQYLFLLVRVICNLPLLSSARHSPPGFLKVLSFRSAAVFVGESGLGPWQNQEMQALLSQFVKRECPVIPVVLPSAKTT